MVGRALLGDGDDVAAVGAWLVPQVHAADEDRPVAGPNRQRLRAARDRCRGQRLPSVAARVVGGAVVRVGELVGGDVLDPAPDEQPIAGPDGRGQSARGDGGGWERAPPLGVRVVGAGGIAGEEVGVALVADGQAPVGQQPGQGPLDLPAMTAQQLTGLDATARDPRADPSSA